MESVRVAARCRSIDHLLENCVSINEEDKEIIVSNDRAGDRIFKLNYIYQNEGQQQIFNELVEPVIKKFLSGYNGTVMAYGQTGSGKTYTMGMTSKISEGNHGILDRTLQYIFTNQSGNDVELSFLEVYKEEIFDLLSESKTKLPVIDFKATGLSKILVRSVNEALSLLEKGIQNRRVGATIANIHSSRSHAIFTIHLSKKSGVNIITSTKLHLIDLAGSESATKASMESRSEGIKINQGLLQLSNVLKALSLSGTHIPYRNSVLTSILKDSLNTNNYIVLIACISPLLKDVHETVSTLKFATRVSSLKGNPESGFVVRQAKTPFKVPNTPSNTRKNATISTPWSLSSRPALRPLNNTIDSPRNFKSQNKWSALKPAHPSSTPYTLNFAQVPLPTLTPLTSLKTRTRAECSDSEWDGLNISCSTTVDAPAHELTERNPLDSQCLPASASSISCMNGCSVNEEMIRSMIADFVRQEVKTQFSRTNRTLFQEDSDSPPTADSSRLSTLKRRLPFSSEKSSADGKLVNMSKACSPSKLVRRSPRLSTREESSYLSQDFNSTVISAQCSSQEKKSLCCTDKNSQEECVLPEEPRIVVRRSMRLSVIPQKNYAYLSNGLTQNAEKIEAVCCSTQMSETKNTEDPPQKLHNDVILDILKNGNARKLQSLPTVGPKTATIIINSRLIHGPLKSLEALREIKGLTKNFAQRFYWANNVDVD